MKMFALLISFVLMVQPVFAGAPLGVSGQSDTANQYPPVVKVPNKQATKITGGVLLETGNKNVLTNPSFENATYNTGWTCTGITPVLETSILADGKKAMTLAASASTFECYNDSSVLASSYMTGAQFAALLKVYFPSLSGTSLKVCSRNNAVTSSTNCVDYITKGAQAVGAFNQTELPFKGTGTSNGISIAGVAVTGNITIDDAFVGPAVLRQSAQTVTTQSVYGSVTASSVTNLNGTTSGSGLFTTSGATLTALTKISVTGTLNATMTSTATGNFVQAQVGTNTQTIISSGSAQTINAFAATTRILNAGDTLGFTIGGTPVPVNYTYAIVATQLSNVQTFSSLGSDYGSTVYTPTLSSTTGVSGNVAFHSRRGEKLHVNGYVTWNGTGGGSTFTVSIPSGLTIDTAKLPSTTNLASRLGSGRWFDSGSTTRPENVEYSSTTSIQFRADDSTGGVPIGTGFASGDFLAYDFDVPIVGWDQTPLVVAQISGLESCANTYECTDEFVAQISSAGVVSGENVDWINGNCSVSTAEHTCTYLTNTLNGNGVGLTAPMVCTGIDTSSTTTAQPVRIYSTLTSGFVGSSNSGRSWAVSCRKSAPDYLGKTAKAVASDQNVATPGTTKSTFCSAKISSAGAISDHRGGCFASCTNANTPVCTFTSNYWASGSVPNCWHDSEHTGANNVLGFATTNSTTFQGNIYTTAGVVLAGNRTYFCHGERQ